MNLLQMLGWGEHKVGACAKWEWLEGPLSSEGHDEFVRRSSSMELFTAEGVDLERAVARSAVMGRPANLARKPAMSGIVDLTVRSMRMDCACDPLGRELVEKAQEQAWVAGGIPSTLLVHPKHPELSGTKVEAVSWADYAVVSNFGILQVLRTMFVPPGLAVLVDHSLLRLVHADEPKGGVWVSLEARNTEDGGHVLLDNLTIPVVV